MGGNRPVNFMLPMACVYMLLAGCALVVLIRTREASSTFGRVLLPILSLSLLVGWVAVQSADWLGPGVWDSHAVFVGLLKTGMYAGVFGLTFFLVRTRDQVEILMWVIVLAGVGQVLIKIMFGSHGTYVNYNHFAGYLEIAIALAIGLMLSKFDQRDGNGWRSSLRAWIRVFLGPKILIRVLIVILVIGLILSRSRMGNIGFFVGLGVAGFIGLWTFRSVGRKVMIFFASLIAIDVFLIGAFYGIDKLQARFEQLDAAVDVRSFLNEHSLALLQDHWFFGSGVGSYYTAYPSVRDERIFGFVENAHNDYAQFWIEFGLGAFLLGLLVLHSAFTAIKVQVVRRSRFMRAVGFASLMAIVSLMVHATVEFNFQLTANASTFMVILALPYLAMTVDRRKGSAL